MLEIDIMKCPVTRKYIGLLCFNGQIILKTNAVFSRDEALARLSKRLPKIEKMYQQKVKVNQGEHIQTRYTPPKMWDNTCYTINPKTGKAVEFKQGIAK